MRTRNCEDNFEGSGFAKKVRERIGENGNLGGLIHELNEYLVKLDIQYQKKFNSMARL